MKRTIIEKKAKATLVLIGNGPAGYKFCERFVKYRLDKQFDLFVYGEEPYPAYDRINLTRFFSVGSAEELYMAPESWYTQKGIVLRTGQQIVEINRLGKWIRTKQGSRIPYDKLIIATGSAPYIPPLEGLALDGVFVYRTLDDLRAIKKLLLPGKRSVVIGGGILGLEAARALINAGMITTVLEYGRHLMNRQLDQAGAELLQLLMSQWGLDVLCDQHIKRIVGKNRVEGIELADHGTFVPADLIILSAGIRPRDELAKSCGLPIGPAGGILVNHFNLTADEHIYAIGECALIAGKTWGLAAPCYEMADIVASRLAGIHKVFSQKTLFIQLKVLETPVISFGDALGEAPGDSGPSVPLTFLDRHAGVYKRINLSADKKYILGGILIGQTEGIAGLLQMTRNKIKIKGDPGALLDNQAPDDPHQNTDLPQDTIICVCEHITKKEIVAAILENRCSRLEEVKKCTRAGTGCESCVPLLEDLLSLMDKAHV